MTAPISNSPSSFTRPPVEDIEAIAEMFLSKTRYFEVQHLAAFCQLFEEQHTEVFPEIKKTIDEKFVHYGFLNIPPNSPIETYRKLVTAIVHEINRHGYIPVSPHVPLELLLQCVESENIPGLSLLLQKFDITPQNIDTKEDGSNIGFKMILTKALYGNHFKVIKFLKSLGFDFEQTVCGVSVNALTLAAMGSEYDLVKFLIKELGANPNLPPQKYSLTPLSAAVAQKDPKMISLLLSLGADKTLPDGNGETPLELGLEELLAKAPTS